MNSSIRVNGRADIGAKKCPRYENTDITISPIVTFKNNRRLSDRTLVASVNISSSPIKKYSGFLGLPIKKWFRYFLKPPESLTDPA